MGKSPLMFKKLYFWVPLVVFLTALLGYFAGYTMLKKQLPVYAQVPIENSREPSAQERQSFDDWQNVFRSSAQKVLPSVVQINVVGYQEQSSRGFEGWPWDFNFGQGNDDTEKKREFRALGSGVIVQQKGDTYYILTNQHVVNNADEIEIVTYDSKSYLGKVIGQDERLDLGLVEVEDKERLLKVAALGDSSKLNIADWVMSIGSPFGFQSSVTSGIISFIGRHGGPQENISDFIQTDAAINRGNSGGALINLKGEVIGINTWISSSGAQVNAGVGFALPINTAKSAIAQFIDKGELEYGWLGVSISIGDLAAFVSNAVGSQESRDILEDMGLLNESGSFITSVYTDSPAARAGMKPGDFIITVDGVRVDGARHLTYLVGTVPPGSRVPMTVLRQGEEIKLTVNIAKRDDDKVDNERLWPGITVLPLSRNIIDRLNDDKLKTQSGLYVFAVIEGSPLAIAGLQRGDVVRQINANRVRSMSDFYEQIARLGKGDKVTIDFQRAGVDLTSPTVTIG